MPALVVVTLASNYMAQLFQQTERCAVSLQQQLGPVASQNDWGPLDIAILWGLWALT